MQKWNCTLSDLRNRRVEFWGFRKPGKVWSTFEVHSAFSWTRVVEKDLVFNGSSNEALSSVMTNAGLSTRHAHKLDLHKGKVSRTEISRNEGRKKSRGGCKPFPRPPTWLKRTRAQGEKVQWSTFVSHLGSCERGIYFQVSPQRQGHEAPPLLTPSRFLLHGRFKWFVVRWATTSVGQKDKHRRHLCRHCFVLPFCPVLLFPWCKIVLSTLVASRYIRRERGGEIPG